MHFRLGVIAVYRLLRTGALNSYMFKEDFDFVTIIIHHIIYNVKDYYR